MLLDYLSVIAVQIISKNRLEFGFFTSESNVRRRLAHLLVQLNLATLSKDEVTLHDSLKVGKTLERLKEVIEHGISENPKELSTVWLKKLKHYQQVNALIQLYRGQEIDVSRLDKANEWKALIKEGALDYEVRLAETLGELSHLRIGEKITSPFDESYYSESGRNAFQNFTRSKFIEVFKKLSTSKTAPTVLDIGCGYGNYIDAVLEANAACQIQGIELQTELFQEVSRRFQAQKQVQVLNEDVLELDLDAPYDVVLLNYVLFYFSREQKKRLFEKIAGSLSDDGVVLICQYYAGIESLKLQLATAQKDMSLSRYIEMHYGNKVLYANALWNETASTFAEAEDWEEFQSLLSECGLRVDAITQADRFYYSLFVSVKKA